MSDPAGSANDLTASIAALSQQLDAAEHSLMRMVQRLAGQQIQLPGELTNSVGEARRLAGQIKKQAQGKLDQLDQLQDLIRQSAVMTSSLDLDAVLERVLDTTITLTHAERALLMLVNPAAGALTLRAARNWDQETLAHEGSQYSTSVAAAAMKQKQPVITTNALTDDRFQGQRSIIGMNLLSILCIPLMLQGEAVGVLYADSRMNVGIFKADLIPLLVAFGTQAAIAIRSASAFQEVKIELDRAREEVQILKIQIDHDRVAQELQAITETDYFQNLSRVADELRADFDMDS